MEIFRTVVECPTSVEKIDYKTPVMMYGSCFAENLGDILFDLKFDVYINPFGIVYNPISIAQNIKRTISGKRYGFDEIRSSANGLFFSFDHHSKFSSSNLLDYIDIINTYLYISNGQLATAQWLFVTLGTAWAFRHKETGKIVANCHKLPASHFERILLQADEICDVWAETIAELQKFNPDIKTVFTISPVRHLRDGAHGNQLGKATLFLAVDKLIAEHKNTAYFPAYEIVMDELRDYRFYDEDMTHINPVAISYIWKRFCETYIDDSALPMMAQVNEINKAVAHEPIHITEDTKKFVEKYLKKIDELEEQAPTLYFHFVYEKKRLKRKLNT